MLIEVITPDEFHAKHGPGISWPDRSKPPDRHRRWLHATGATSEQAAGSAITYNAPPDDEEARLKLQRMYHELVSLEVMRHFARLRLVALDEVQAPNGNATWTWPEDEICGPPPPPGEFSPSGLPSAVPALKRLKEIAQRHFDAAADISIKHHELPVVKRREEEARRRHEAAAAAEAAMQAALAKHEAAIREITFEGDAGEEFERVERNVRRNKSDESWQGLASALPPRG